MFTPNSYSSSNKGKIKKRSTSKVKKERSHSPPFPMQTVNVNENEISQSSSSSPTFITSMETCKSFPNLFQLVQHPSDRSDVNVNAVESHQQTNDCLLMDVDWQDEMMLHEGIQSLTIHDDANHRIQVSPAPPYSSFQQSKDSDSSVDPNYLNITSDNEERRASDSACLRSTSNASANLSHRQEMGRHGKVQERHLNVPTHLFNTASASHLESGKLQNQNLLPKSRSTDVNVKVVLPGKRHISLSASCPVSSLPSLFPIPSSMESNLESSELHGEYPSPPTDEEIGQVLRNRRGTETSLTNSLYNVTEQRYHSASSVSGLSNRSHRFDRYITRLNSYLYIGSVEAVYNEALLCSFGINGIVDVTNCLPDDVPPSRKMNTPCKCPPTAKKHTRPKLSIGFSERENDSTDITQFFNDINSFIEGHRQKGRSVLLASMEGNSRCAFIAIQYLMKYEQYKVNDAFLQIKRRRPSVTISINFRRILDKIERSQKCNTK